MKIKSLGIPFTTLVPLWRWGRQKCGGLVMAYYSTINSQMLHFLQTFKVRFWTLRVYKFTPSHNSRAATHDSLWKMHGLYSAGCSMLYNRLASKNVTDLCSHCPPKLFTIFLLKKILKRCNSEAEKPSQWSHQRATIKCSCHENDDEIQGGLRYLFVIGVGRPSIHWCHNHNHHNRHNYHKRHNHHNCNNHHNCHNHHHHGGILRQLLRWNIHKHFLKIPPKMSE